MVKIFLETQSDRTPEYWFFKTLLKRLGIASDAYDIIAVGGKDKLFNATNTNLMAVNTLEGGRNVVIFDADSEKNCGGYSTRSDEILSERCRNSVDFELFLMPNNSEDGDFETMIASIARTNLHKDFFDCFTGYEMCIASHLGVDGTPRYETPNQKAKLYAYITSMKMSNTKRNKAKSGNWLFDNSEYWDIDSPTLEPLKSFLLSCFK